MTGPEFVRLPEGRLWHVTIGYRTACDRDIETVAVAHTRSPERLDGIVPTGAWMCRRCRDTLAGWLHAVDQAIHADPRTRRPEPIPEPEPEPTPPPGYDTWAARWYAPGAWSAVRILDQLTAELDGRTPPEAQYVAWVRREHLNPWGELPGCWPAFRTRELLP